MGAEYDARAYRGRRPLRTLLQWASKLAFWLVCDLEIEGQENFPDSGPLLVVGNHFSFLDPPIMVRISPIPMEFIGGALFPHAPKIVHFIPRLWGYLPVYRGTGSRFALQEGERVLRRGGVLALFPEAGAWAEILRPGRPGAAFLSSHTQTRLLPVGIDGLPDVFPMLRRGRRAKVTVRIGEPFGPCPPTEQDREGRKVLDEFTTGIMERLAGLIPAEKGGIYSSDPTVRAAAEGSELYPWKKTRETQDTYEAPELE
jgi:1-acyl-sn-glycerol-3-phosphate acyltransferase